MAEFWKAIKQTSKWQRQWQTEKTPAEKQDLASRGTCPLFMGSGVVDAWVPTQTDAPDYSTLKDTPEIHWMRFIADVAAEGNAVAGFWASVTGDDEPEKSRRAAYLGDLLEQEFGIRELTAKNAENLTSKSGHKMAVAAIKISKGMREKFEGTHALSLIHI